VEDNQVDLIYCPTEDMIADLLTKQLPKEKYEKFISMMGMEIMT
jgi:hypothetical protein